MTNSIFHRIVRSGNVTEIYMYDREQGRVAPGVVHFEDEVEPLVRQEPKRLTKTFNLNKREEEYKRSVEAIRRTKKKMERLINSNVGQWGVSEKFLTLTFEDVVDEQGMKKQPNREFVVKAYYNFMKRFKYKYSERFEYIAVIERGTAENGTKRLHLHVITFGLDYIHWLELQKIWKYGKVYIEEITFAKGVAKYVSKYIEKTLEDGYIEKGQRFYFPSKGLYKPEVLTLSDEEMKEFTQENELGDMFTEIEFEHEFTGKGLYKLFVKNVGLPTSKKQKIPEHLQIMDNGNELRRFA